MPTATSRTGGRAAFAANAAGAQVAARPHAAWTGSGTVRQATIGLFVALAYYAGARLGFLLVFPGSPLSVIWPPNAIVLAALLLVQPRAWWIVLLGVLPAHLVVEWQSGVVPLAVPGLYLTNCGEALLGATIVRRLSDGGPPWLGTLQQVVVYVVGAAIAAPFVASFLDTSVVVVTHWAAPREYWLLWEQRFISAVLTNLTVAPVILLLACGGWRQGRTLARRRRVEAALLALSILGSSYVAFSPRTALLRDMPELLYLLVPVLLWAAVRFGVGGISTSLLAVALLAAGWADASGLFVARAPAAAVVTLQLFLIALGAPAFCLAGLVKERERDNAALRASQEQYRAVVETQTEMITRYLPDTTLTFVNEANCRMMGKSREELLGTRWLDTLPDAAREPVRATIQSLLEHPRVLTVEYQVRLPDGSLCWQQWVNRTILDTDGRVVELQGIGRDVTERNQLEREREEARANELASREVNRHMDEFLATAAHDLRQPVTSAVMGIGLAQRRLQRLTAVASGPQPLVGSQSTGPRDETWATYDALERAGQAVEHMSRLVNCLFDLAQAQSGTLELKPVACNLAALVREQVELQHMTMADRTVCLDLPTKRPVPVVADADRLGQVLTNYLTNALKYSPPDKPIAVSLEVHSRLARVAVRDEGPGLPPEEQMRVWEPFHRAPGIAVQSAGGESLGMGLHICKTIVDAHGGQVGVESEVGQGSTFWFTLPLAMHEEAGDDATATPLS